MPISDRDHQPPGSPSSDKPPSSPESLASVPPPFVIPDGSPHNTEQNDYHDDQDYIRPVLKRGKPGSLHLTPCTFQQYQDLGYDHSDPYELVDGLLISVPPMDDPEQYSLGFWLVQLLTYLPSSARRHKIQGYNQRPLRLLFGDRSVYDDETSVPKSPDQVSPRKAVGGSSLLRRDEGQSSKSHARSSRSKSKSEKKGNNETSSRTEDETSRRPDFCVVNADQGSENTETPVSPFEDKRERTGEWKKAIMVGEITSTNRTTDLNRKKKDYERAKILHKLNENTNEYDKKVYEKKEVVKCSFFEHWKLTADQMLDYKYIESLVDEERAKESEENAKLRRDSAKIDEDLKKKDEDLKKKDEENAKLREEIAKLDEESAKLDEESAKLDEEIAKKDEVIMHFKDYVQGRRKTPPRILELDDSMLKRTERTKAEHGGASSSPESPKSPPLRVRKIQHTDVKSSSRHAHKTDKAEKNK